MAPNSSRLLSMDKIGDWPNSAGISGSDLDVVETRWASPVAGPNHLLGLPLAAVRHAPQPPPPARIAPITHSPKCLARLVLRLPQFLSQRRISGMALPILALPQTI